MSRETAYAQFFDHAIRDLSGPAAGAKVLDLGCGAGGLVDALRSAGYDAFGCDVPGDYSILVKYGPEVSSRLRFIEMDPYRLPYDDATFDFVVSSQVLEHIQNKEQAFREIKRVLKPGGLTMHVFPSKWILPVEPHQFVPLASWFWPNVPRWWLALWAILGVRNSYQREMGWRAVVEENAAFMRHAVDYQPIGVYKRLLRSVFGNGDSPMGLYIKRSPGRYAALLRRLPGSGLLASLSGVFRQRFVVARA